MTENLVSRHLKWTPPLTPPSPIWPLLLNTGYKFRLRNAKKINLRRKEAKKTFQKSRHIYILFIFLCNLLLSEDCTEVGEVAINTRYFYQVPLTEVTVKSLKTRTGLVENIGLKRPEVVWAWLAQVKSTSRQLQPGGIWTHRTFTLHAAPRGWLQLHQGSRNHES